MDSAFVFASGMALLTLATMLVAAATRHASWRTAVLRLLATCSVAGFGAVAYGAYLQLVAAGSAGGWAWFAAGLMLVAGATALQRVLAVPGDGAGP